MSHSDRSSPQHEAAATLAERWQSAWNLHHMDRATALISPDADFVNVAGRWLRGRSQFLNHHAHLHRMQMRDSQWTNLALTVRSLSEQFGIAPLEWRIEGDRDPEGRARAPRRGLFTWVLAFDGATALIAAAHNTNVLSPAKTSGSIPTPDEIG
jgi:uncharacterized protein (TIGR02246 family)